MIAKIWSHFDVDPMTAQMQGLKQVLQITDWMEKAPPVVALDAKDYPVGLSILPKKPMIDVPLLVHNINSSEKFYAYLLMFTAQACANIKEQCQKALRSGEQISIAS